MLRTSPRPYRGERSRKRSLAIQSSSGNLHCKPYRGAQVRMYFPNSEISRTQRPHSLSRPFGLKAGNACLSQASRGAIYPVRFCLGQGKGRPRQLRWWRSPFAQITKITEDRDRPMPAALFEDFIESAPRPGLESLSNWKVF